jgi:hypothetical protein
MRHLLQDLTDRAAISQLIDRYTILLDTQDEKGCDDDWPRYLFAEDCHLTFPIGSYQGLDRLAEFHLRAKQRFVRTHHVSTNHTIVIHDEDRADVRFQMLAVHEHLAQTRQRQPTDPGPLFKIGGYYDAETVRTADGWRFRKWTFHVVWTEGVAPADLL